MPEVVLYDTVGLLAIWDPSDPYHPVARDTHADALRRRLRFVATEAVFLECGNAMARSRFRAIPFSLRNELAESDCLLVPTAEDLRTAWSNYFSDRPGGASIVDHISFLLMRRLGIRRAFTNDRHFREAGFEIMF